MSGNFVFASVLEVIVGALLIWGAFHEESLADFEGRLFAHLKAGVQRLHARARRAALARKGRLHRREAGRYMAS